MITKIHVTTRARKVHWPSLFTACRMSWNQGVWIPVWRPTITALDVSHVDLPCQIPTAIFLCGWREASRHVWWRCGAMLLIYILIYIHRSFVSWYLKYIYIWDTRKRMSAVGHEANRIAWLVKRVCEYVDNLVVFLLLACLDFLFVICHCAYMQHAVKDRTVGVMSSCHGSFAFRAFAT